jgi:hypothetical protein
VLDAAMRVQTGVADIVIVADAEPGIDPDRISHLVAQNPARWYGVSCRAPGNCCGGVPPRRSVRA